MFSKLFKFSDKNFSNRGHLEWEVLIPILDHLIWTPRCMPHASFWQNWCQREKPQYDCTIHHVGKHGRLEGESWSQTWIILSELRGVCHMPPFGKTERQREKHLHASPSTILGSVDISKEKSWSQTWIISSELQGVRHMPLLVRLNAKRRSLCIAVPSTMLRRVGILEDRSWFQMEITSSALWGIRHMPPLAELNFKGRWTTHEVSTELLCPLD